MWETFTNCAREVMVLAGQAARELNYEHIGTEHVLLGLVREGRGTGGNILRNFFGVDLKRVDGMLAPGPDEVTMDRLPETPRMKKVIAYASEDARNLGENNVGTKHILLGLLRDQDGAGAKMLMELGLKLEEVREEVLNLLDLGAGAANDRTNDAKEPDEGEVAKRVLKYFLRKYSLGRSTRRELGNIAKETGVPFNRLLEFFRPLFQELLDETLDTQSPEIG